MPTLEEGLGTHLRAHPGLAALVAGRVYPVQAPQGGAAPYVTFRRQAGIGIESLCGPAGLLRARYEVISWAKTYQAARAVAAQVRAALDGLRGNLGGYRVQGIRFLGDEDLFLPEGLLYHVATDIEVWAAEPAPV